MCLILKLLNSLLVADFCAAAVLISFGAVIGKATISQLLIMATVEGSYYLEKIRIIDLLIYILIVVVQSVNEHIGLEYLKV